MVDFQSRDTRRGPTTDDEDDETTDDEPSDEEEAPDEAGTPAADTDEAATTDGDSDETETADTERVGDPETTGGESVADAAGTAQPEDGDETATPASAADAGLGDESRAPAADETADSSRPAAETTTVSRSVDVAVVTVGVGGDQSVEDAMTAAFEAAGHEITVRERLRGEYDTLQQVTDRLVSRDDVDVVVTAGGVGITADEVTIEAVHPLLEKALPGFGEAFRTLLYDVVGTGIVAVRSAAGVAEGTLVFCLPGDAEAAQLAVEEILVTEAPELVAHLDR